MTISYTDNFNFPLLDSGSDGWDAVMNGMLVDVDRLVAESRNPLIWEDTVVIGSSDLALAEARSPLIWESDSDDHLLLNDSGKEATSEVLTYNGDVLLYVLEDIPTTKKSTSEVLTYEGEILLYI